MDALQKGAYGFLPLPTLLPIAPCVGRRSRSRGGFSHCLADAKGCPIAFHLTPGQATDCKAHERLIDPEQAPKALLADKAYDTDPIRNDLRQGRIKAVIPPKSNRKKQIRYHKKLYRERNWIERVIGHLKINRAVATRLRSTRRNFHGHAKSRGSPRLDQICAHVLDQRAKRPSRQDIPITVV